MHGITEGENTIDYAYNGDGQRVSKTVNGTKTEYYYNGSILAGQKTEDDILTFMYDNNSDIFGFIYNGTEYYYIKNAQNDVIAIADAGGNIIANYYYDAWGKLVETTGNTEIAELNPIRYRSYYYDSETEWYYLNTRYYSADMCRFVNSDTYSLPTATPTELTDKNLFSYCDNNPITRYDDNGDFWHIVIGAVVGGIIGGIAEATGEDSNAKTIAISAIAGALSGGLSCTGLGVGAIVASNIAISAIESFSNQSIKNGVQNVNYGEVILDGAIGGAFSAIGGAGNGTKHLNKAGKQTVKRTVNKFANKGFKTGVKEMRKAAKHYFKSNRNYYKKYSKGLILDGISFGVSLFQNLKKRLNR